jgi:hypothetical protein
MGLFNKTDPAVKKQLALEGALKAKRANLDDLSERRKVAETNAVAHREKAWKLASEGADDTALSSAEAALRREQDRVATLSDAITKVEIAVADLEREIGALTDQRCRAETAAAVNALVEKWGSAGTAFDAAVRQLVDVARESAVIIPDAEPLKVFAEAVRQQVGPEADLITNVLQAHAKAVLTGRAPPSPKPADPVQPKRIERPVPVTPFAGLELA